MLLLEARLSEYKEAGYSRVASSSNNKLKKALFYHGSREIVTALYQPGELELHINNILKEMDNRDNFR